MSGTTVLLVEDDRTSAALVRRTLGPEGYSILEAGTAETAWERILEITPAPAVALLDVDLPGLDGFELCRRIRGHARLRTAHVILLTARTTLEALDEGFEAGADDYVRKPFNPVELRARVRAGVRAARMRSELYRCRAQLEQVAVERGVGQTLVRVCDTCSRVHGEDGQWRSLDSFLAQTLDIYVTHRYCPVCASTVVAELDPLIPSTGG